MLHVLIAGDESLAALTMAVILESGGVRVTVARNDVEAIEADADDPADLLITDMRMPVMDGAALIRAMREGRPNLPIIVASGFSDDLPRPETGRLVVPSKPYNPSVVAPTITALLSGRVAGGNGP